MLKVDVVELVLTKNSFGCLSTCLALLDETTYVRRSNSASEKTYAAAARKKTTKRLTLLILIWLLRLWITKKVGLLYTSAIECWGQTESIHDLQG